MSKKHYIALAAIIAKYAADLDDVGVALVSDIADYLQTDNPRFNRERFIDACVSQEGA